MSQPLWGKLIALAKIDKELATFNEEVTSLENSIEKNEGQISLINDGFVQKEQQLSEKRKKIKSIELKVKSIDALEKEKKEAIKTVKNEKEYNALEKELSAISIQRQDEEDILVNLWQNVENTKDRLSKEKSKFEEETGKLQESTDSIREKIKKTSRLVEKLKLEKKKMANDIPKEWLTTYEKMSNRVENPIVSITNSSCSHCYYHVLPQDLSKIKKGDLLHCRSCFRLLYNEPAEQVEEDSI